MTITNLLKYSKVCNDDDRFADVLKVTEDVYDGPSAIVAKPTRFGFTSSMSKIAEVRNDKLLMIQPTNKINETVKKAAPSAIPIYGHKHCEYFIEHNDPFLSNLPISLPRICPRIGGCEEFPECDLTRSWYESTPVLTINYQKFIAVMFGYSPTDKSEISLLREQFKTRDHIMFDESHIISLENSPSVDINYDMKSIIPIKYENLRKVYYDFCDLAREICNDDIINQLKETKNYLKSESFLSFPCDNANAIGMTEQTQAFSDLKRIASERALLKFSEDDIKYLMNVITLMTCRSVTANLITSSKGDTYSIKGKPTENSPTIKNAIKLFLKDICPNAKVFFVSGTQFEKYPGMFSEIAGRELANVCVPDIKHTNAKMTIVPDTWTYSSVVIAGKDLSGTQDKRIKDQILDIMAKEPGQPIYIICFNRKLQEKIVKRRRRTPLQADGASEASPHKDSTTRI